MGRNMRRGYDGAFKATVALKSIQGEKTLVQRCREWVVHANQIGLWSEQLIKELPSLLSDRHMKRDKEHDELISELYRQIGKRNKPEAYHGGGRLAQKNISHAPWIPLSRGHYRLLQLLCSGVGDLTPTLDTPFYLSALEQALELSTTEICREYPVYLQAIQWSFLLLPEGFRARNGVATYVL